MQEVTVKLPLREDRGYKIYVGADTISQVGSLFELGRYSKIMVITDETIKPLLLGRLTASLPEETVSFQLPAGEQHKDIDSVQKVWTALHEAGCDRKSLVVNLGGGVIGDVGGFAASTYMRGIDFLNVPTTLLAQADAGIGGKTGFNYAGVKNLVGSFQQPVGIVIDTGVLDSLPKREFVAGFGEIIKHGAIADKQHFEDATSKAPLEFSKEELADIITHSCRIKASVVQGDETEGGSRKLLNFGHTVGHAVEALSLGTDDPLLHGEAVSIGMAAEADMAVRMGLLPAEDLESLKKALVGAGLPVRTEGYAPEDIIDKMRFDKKNAGGKLKFTLIDRIGHAVNDQDVAKPVLTEALEAITD